MDIFVLVKTVVRRWWVVVPTLALTAVAVVLVLTRVEPTYEATASLLLASPQLSQTADTSGPQAGIPATIVAEIVQGDEVRSELTAAGGASEYRVEVGGDGSILRVVATDADDARVVPTVEAVLAAIEDTVAARQAGLGVPAELATSVEVLTRPSQARPVTVTGADDEPRTVYEATGSAAIVSPLTGEGTGPNPYQASSGTLRILQEVSSSPEARAAVAEGGGSPEYTVHMENRDAAPILYVTAEGTDPANMMRTLEGVVTYLNAALAERQEVARAPESTWIEFQPLSMPTAATETASNLRRPLLTIVGLGIIAAVSLAVLVDNLMGRRAGGRTPGPAGGSPGNGAATTPAGRRRYEQVR